MTGSQREREREITPRQTMAEVGPGRGGARAKAFLSLAEGPCCAGTQRLARNPARPPEEPSWLWEAGPRPGPAPEDPESQAARPQCAPPSTPLPTQTANLPRPPLRRLPRLLAAATWGRHGAQRGTLLPVPQDRLPDTRQRLTPCVWLAPAALHGAGMTFAAGAAAADAQPGVPPS